MSPSLHLAPKRIGNKRKPKKQKLSLTARLVLGMAAVVAFGSLTASHYVLSSKDRETADQGHKLGPSIHSKVSLKKKDLVNSVHTLADTKPHRRLNSSTAPPKHQQKGAAIQRKVVSELTAERKEKETVPEEQHRRIEKLAQQQEAKKIFQPEKIQPKQTTAAERHKKMLERQKMFLEQRQRREIVVQHPVVPYNISNDPLQNPKFPQNFSQVNVTPAVEYLGVLIDGGRHYFPMDWMKRTVDRLADMNYNLIHLRLTDDQAFNVLLDSHPELAYPSHVNNDDRKVWTAKELRELTKYCRARGVSIMPEINVPGHGGAWAGVPGMVVHCPEFICDKGYGLPINVTHPGFRPLLTDVLKEVVDIFDPPFLHLGGDEVDMSAPCFAEMDSEMFDYVAFEQRLRSILKVVGYPVDQVVRWELTGQAHYERTGGIEQFWFSHPGQRHKAAGRWFVSTWLYFDTNKDQNAYEVWTKTRHSFYHIRQKTVPTAIIAGTFELSTTWWYDRNILGRLLAVAMGASNQTVSEMDPKKLEEKVVQQYTELCNQLGFGNSICLTQGRPVIPTYDYVAKWKAGWTDWKRSICSRMTETVDTRRFQDNFHEDVEQMANEFFWTVFGQVIAANSRAIDEPKFEETLKALQSHSVTHAGVILDLTSSLVPSTRLTEIMDIYVSNLGFNLIQLPVVSDHGFVVRLPSLPRRVANSWVMHTNSAIMPASALEEFVDHSRRKGIKVMPEVSVSTRATGWQGSGFVTACPIHFCKTGSIVAAVSDPQFAAAVYTVIYEFRRLFSSELLHLGYDEREKSRECLEEAKKSFGDFEVFESKLQSLLQLGGIPSDNVLRYIDPDEQNYAVQAGSRKHFPSTVDADLETHPDSFVTVDILQDAWPLYQHVKGIMAKKPFGIMAEVRQLRNDDWYATDIPGRLLVYALAISDAPTVATEEELAEQYAEFCKTLKDSTSFKPGRDCTLPKPIDDPPAFETETEAHLKKICNSMTFKVREHRPIPVQAFYEPDKIEKARAAPSPFADADFVPIHRKYPPRRQVFEKRPEKLKGHADEHEHGHKTNPEGNQHHVDKPISDDGGNARADVQAE